MNESTDANRPSGPSPLQDALEFIEAQDETYTDEALYDALIDAGYPSDIASEALRKRDEGSTADIAEETTARGNDQRTRAALILIAAAVAAWAAVAAIVWLAGRDYTYSEDGIGLTILAFVIGIVLLFSLVAAGGSRKLQRGAQGALVTFVVIPFVIFFGLAGTCVVSFTGLEG